MIQQPGSELDESAPAVPQVAYTRAALDEYLAAVAERRQELRAEIVAAEARAARAELAAARITTLERSVGELLVGALARGGAPAVDIDLNLEAPVGAGASGND